LAPGFSRNCGDIGSGSAAVDLPDAFSTLFERHDNGGAAIRRDENRPPFLGCPRRDEFGDRVARRRRGAEVADKFFRQSDRLAERQPEFLLDRAAGDDFAVFRRI